ncbi:PiggyBac transposable element-derived protein 4 [Plakobranchus ocellatus]|uniref:PiggyBac transposable element-derived protein 4 n=1 Tax=Plakobranchus ocellatus TaxID=259542 RepID=A0AAV4D4Z9_9GAST|nr:PiggyBac transposable element-derived protein 4 [Plakobranchus ocellatus]
MERQNIFHHFEYGALEDKVSQDLGNNEEQAEESESDHCSESEEDVISDNDDISFSDNNSDANEPDLTSLQPVDMIFLSNQVETAIVDEEPTPTSEATALLEDVHGFYQANDGNVWVKTTSPTGRTPSCNIFRPPVRQVTNARNIYTVGSAYKRFVNDKMVDRIVICTNKGGKRMLGDKWTETYSTEVEGFVGCLLHMGALKDSNSPTSVLWSKTDGNTLVKACFSREIFKDQQRYAV